MADVLTLGGISFTGYSPPDKMGAGGKQAMVVHKLPGGSRHRYAGAGRRRH